MSHVRVVPGVPLLGGGLLAFDQRGLKRIECLDDCSIGPSCGPYPWPCIEEARRTLEENPDMKKICISETLNLWLTLKKDS